MTKKLVQTYINHVVFVIDRSGSMGGMESEVIKVFDSQISVLAQRSKELDQETRASVYLFADTVECIVYDKDVLRLPSLKNLYNVYGGTAMIDGTLKALEDLAKTPELYGDHAFLTYVLTDGYENQSRHTAGDISKKLSGLPENWTVAVLVPNQQGVFEAKKFGFSPNNIQIWNTDAKGISEIGKTISKTTDAFMQARATGVRGTKNLFSLDTSNLNTKTVAAKLEEIKAADYTILPVRQDAVIKEYIESWTKEAYRQGSAYYELTKKEKVGAGKQIAVQNKLNGKVYSGLSARQVLGLPNTEVQVAPAATTEYTIFVQSTSVNRKLIKGTNILVLK